MDEFAESSKKFSSVFLDPAWLVAFLAGCWGVVISLEEFRAADFIAVLAGIVICLKIGAETQLLHKDRKPLVFIVSFLVVSGIIAADLRWTAHKKAEAEEHGRQLAQLSELSGLKERLQEMEHAQSMRAEAQKVQDAKAGQQLDDIETENRALRKSVETKDAALVSIAKDQYALNFFPQVSISTNGSTENMYVGNNGKTNIELTGLIIDGREPVGILQTVAPSANASFTIQEIAKQLILQRAGAANNEVSIEGTLNMTTLDKKKYSMAFTWHFAVKEAKIDRSFVIDGPIREDK
jgi:hypothetical protein